MLQKTQIEGIYKTNLGAPIAHLAPKCRRGNRGVAMLLISAQCYCFVFARWCKLHLERARAWGMRCLAWCLGTSEIGADDDDAAH